MIDRQLTPQELVRRDREALEHWQRLPFVVALETVSALIDRELERTTGDDDAQNELLELTLATVKVRNRLIQKLEAVE